MSTFQAASAKHVVASALSAQGIRYKRLIAREARLSRPRSGWLVLISVEGAESSTQALSEIQHALPAGVILDVPNSVNQCADSTTPIRSNSPKINEVRFDE